MSLDIWLALLAFAVALLSLVALAIRSKVADHQRALKKLGDIKHAETALWAQTLNRLAEVEHFQDAPHRVKVEIAQKRREARAKKKGASSYAMSNGGPRKAPA